MDAIHRNGLVRGAFLVGGTGEGRFGGENRWGRLLGADRVATKEMPRSDAR